MVPGLSASSSYITPSSATSSSSSQDSVFDVNINTQNPVPERSGSMSEELRGIPMPGPLKPKTKMKKKDAKTYTATCRTGCRTSEKNLSMNVVFQSHGETWRLDIETLPVLLMNYQWSREQKWNRAWASTVSFLTSRRRQIVISA